MHVVAHFPKRLMIAAVSREKSNRQKLMIQKPYLRLLLDSVSLAGIEIP